MGWLDRALDGRFSVLWAAAAPLAFACIDGSHMSVLPQPPGARGERTAEQAAIEGQPVCIGSSVESAGALSDILYYRAVAVDSPGQPGESGGTKVEVGYFAFFSEERPWGNNWLTWSVVPALAVDLFYSRALLIAPGLQRALYGAGDVEGVGIVYDRSPDGSLRFDHAIADDGTHDTVALSREQAFALDGQRPTFYSQVWSHQLGGRGAMSFHDLAYVRCYDASSIRPLPDSVARAFHVDGDFRAPPAHVERTGGRRIDVASPIVRLGSPDGPDPLPAHGRDHPCSSVRAPPPGSRCAG
jgi:hypothetical protein